MTLEDHLGDILYKARLHAGVPLDAVAKAAGLAPDELATLEQAGNPLRDLDYSALASLLGLDSAKLQGLAEGWSPASVDLSQWRELRAATTGDPPFTVNCYLVWDEVTREAALFDTGFDAVPLLALIDENQLQLRHIFLTHLHSDHVAALPGLRSQFPKVRLHSNSRQAPPEQRNRPNDFISLGSLRITNRETPGHSDDGVTYIVGTWPEDAPHTAFVGDAIFAGSMGKAPEQASLARQKIRQQVLSLPPATLLCPGHGPLTTVAEEVTHNPFF